MPCTFPESILSPFNPKFASLDPDGSVFMTSKMRLEVASLAPMTLGSIEPLKVMVLGIHLLPMPPSPSSSPTPAPSVPPTMYFGPTYSANSKPNARQPGTFRVQPATDP